jgi:hypothetical protein
MAASVEAEEALFVDDSELARLATDIPDLRMRLGIGETEVFGGTGFSLVKVQLQVGLGPIRGPGLRIPAEAGAGASWSRAE